MTIRTELTNRDWVEIEIDKVDFSSRVTAIRGKGCLELLNRMNKIRALLPAPAKELYVFSDQSHTSLLIGELLTKARGAWKYPYQDTELCHCRAIPLARVDAAIVAGFHTVEEIAQETSAGTACGSCRTDSQACITYRLKDLSKE